MSKVLDEMTAGELLAEAKRLQRYVDQDDKAAEIQRLKAEVNKLTAFNARRMALETKKMELERALAEVNAELAKVGT